MVRLHIARYKEGGARLVTMSNVRAILKITREGLKDIVADNKYTVYKITDKAILKKLADVEAIKSDQEPIYMGRISELIKVLHKIGAWPLVVKMLKDANKSEPPSSANDIGSRRLDRATNPMPPLPAIIVPSAEHLVSTCDPDDFSPTEERSDREPVFIFSKPGR